MTDVLDTVGTTPVVRLKQLAGNGPAELYAKCEALNPGGSIKDRPARFIIRQARRLGLLRPGGVIIESTSGNFGVALAMIGAADGYRVIIVVDPKVPLAHRRAMEAYGAEVVEVREPDESGGYFKPRLELANQLARDTDGAFRPDQHFSLMNAAAHFQETGPEIFAQMDGMIDYLVVAVSTAGQLRGLAEFFRARGSGTKIVGVDAVGSGVFGGPRHAYLQSGIGLAWPPSNLDLSLVQRAYKVADDDAISTARLLARAEGLLAGPSSGSVAFAGLHLAESAEPGARIVCVLSDTGQRYLETIYDDDWLADRGVKICADLSGLRARAAGLSPMSRESLSPAAGRAGCFVPSQPPASTTVLNDAARKLMGLTGGPAGQETMYEYVWLDALDSCQGGEPQDIEQVVDLVLKVSRSDPYVGLPPDSSPEDVDTLRTRLQSVLVSGHAHVLVIRDGQGETVGCVVLTRGAAHNQRHIAELTTGAIHAEHRGRGVVAGAFAEIGELCRQLGVELLKLDVREGIPAEQIWRHYGFEEYGRLADYGRIGGASYSGIFMAQPVEKLIARVSQPVSTDSQEA